MPKKRIKNLGGEKKKKMKTKKKMIALVEIVIVLCSVFLVTTLPGIAAGQNQETLGIYGNANEDDTIDMGDVVYTKLAIFGKKAKTELCDAKYDGRINVLDVIQTKLIILGKEKELTIIDTKDRIVMVNKPIRRIIAHSCGPLEILRTLKVPKDITVGRFSQFDPSFFPEFSELPSVGSMWNPDIEEILNLHPDTVILFGTGHADLDPAQDVLESAGITVLRFNCQTPEIHREEVEKLGYIFDKEEEAEEYLDWRDKILNSVKEKAKKLQEGDKPKVYYESSGSYTAYASTHILQHVTMAGGKYLFPEVKGSVDPEAVIEQNPDIIVKRVWKVGGYDVDADNTAELEEIRGEIISRPELQNVKAVKDGRVYIVTAHLLSSLPPSGCRRFVSVAYFAKWFHPELFEDLNPKAVHQEYLTRFQGLDIDLDKQGVFAYPEPS